MWLAPEIKNMTLGTLVTEARKNVENLLYLAMDRRIRLAVTGLNQAGKTIFITSLIHQLLLGARLGGLPFFQVVAEGRFQGAKIVLQPNMDIAAFRYDQFIQTLTQNPSQWPRATDGLSEIRLAIRFRPTGLLHSRLRASSTVYLDIIDYPGEWLLDLPLLGQNFFQWSNEVFTLCTMEPRLALAQPWLEYLAGLDPKQNAEEGILRQASRLFTDFLLACKAQPVGLSYLQPGRFLIPGDLRDAPLLTFCPIRLNTESARPGSLGQVMAERFESYKDLVVRRFYQQHFSNFDRQIVLVDVLKGLNRGPNHFDDMSRSLKSILKNFDYGRSSLVSRLFQPRIDRLLFAATKSDHVAANQHSNLERLLKRMVMDPVNEASFYGVAVETMAISSVVSTETVVKEHEGRRLSFVLGRPKGRQEDVLLFGGEIPEKIPKAETWQSERFNFLEFEPRIRPDLADDRLPHLRLDLVLDFLLGDKLT
ncbi:MAG: YcjX family protein [Magnetococcales bacterium]|nr:YcjX family protein [Magnetococcales bacterium]HIJ84254.1 YcjX family protein [Magnetococcales bacterium]